MFRTLKPARSEITGENEKMKTTRKKIWKSLALGLTLSIGMYMLPVMSAEAAVQKPLIIAEQGSFTVGGTYKQHPGTFSQENFIAEDGQRAYGDFAYVEYQKPVKAKRMPLIFQHGGAQSKRTWESGPDGREAAAKLDEAHIFIDDTPGLSILDLRSRARRLQAEGGLDFIVIDYLQLMQGSRSCKANDNRQQEVTEISRGLKALARELQVPVLALSQLSRSVELRQSKQPMLSDLRESGSLEQDADIVMFLYREDYYKGAEDTPSHITELIVAKHRNGPTGRVTLFFKEDCTKFISLSRKRKGV